MPLLRKWIPALSMTLVSLISYIDRNTLALLAPTMLAELHLSGEQYGWVVSGFSFAYMAGNLLWGRWIDTYGLRVAMAVAVGFWSFASASHAWAAGFFALFAARAALGFGEGATFPGGLRTVVQTLEPELRARGTAVAYSGGSLGAVVTPVLMTPVFIAFGWRGAFYFTGIIGLLWILLWLGVSRRENLRRLPAAAIGEPARANAKDSRFWAFVFLYAFGAIPLGFVIYFAPLFLRHLGKTQVELGSLLWIPPLGWEIGYFVWGWWTDRSVAGAGFSIAAYRRLLLLLSLLSLPIAAVPFFNALPTVMSALFFSMFIGSGFLIGSVSYATTVFGLRDSAFLAGLGAGSWSALVAIVMPLTGRLFDQHNYIAAFLVPAVFPLLGYFLWTALHNNRLATLNKHA